MCLLFFYAHSLLCKIAVHWCLFPPFVALLKPTAGAYWVLRHANWGNSCHVCSGMFGKFYDFGIILLQMGHVFPFQVWITCFNSIVHVSVGIFTMMCKVFDCFKRCFIYLFKFVLCTDPNAEVGLINKSDKNFSNDKGAVLRQKVP